MTNRREPHFGPPDKSTAQIESLSTASEFTNEPAESSRGLLVILGLAGVLFALFLGGPMLAEQASGPCSALEYRLVGEIGANIVGDPNRAAGANLAATVYRSLAPISRGEFASAVVRQEYPNTPPLFGCAAAYWQLMVLHRT